MNSKVELFEKNKKGVARTYRRKQPSLKPDQPLPHPPEGESPSGVQEAFRSPAGCLALQSAFDLSQTASETENIGNSVVENTKEPSSPLELGNYRVKGCTLLAKAKMPKQKLAPAQHPCEQPALESCIGDSDSCDFNE